MQKNTNSPRARLKMRKLTKDFDPFNPTDILKEEVSKITLPKSGYLNTSMRGKTFKELELDQLEYYAFDLKQGDEKNKFIAKLYYFCRLTRVMNQENITREDIFTMIDDTFNSDKKENVDSNIEQNNEDDLDF